MGSALGSQGCLVWDLGGVPAPNLHTSRDFEKGASLPTNVPQDRAWLEEERMSESGAVTLRPTSRPGDAVLTSVCNSIV